MIIGIGIDLVDITRLTAQLKRTPELGRRLSGLSKTVEKPSDLARNFAILEALYKALPKDQKKELINFKLSKDSTGKPRIHHEGINQKGESAFLYHVSITHERDIVVALVVIEKKASHCCSCRE